MIRIVFLLTILLIVSAIDYYLYTLPEEIVGVNPLNLGAKCDGKTDDTEGFRKAVDAAFFDTGIVLVHNGCYVSELRFGIPDGAKLSQILYQGDGGTIYWGTPSGLYFRLKANREHKKEPTRTKGASVNYPSEEYTPDIS